MSVGWVIVTHGPFHVFGLLGSPREALGCILKSGMSTLLRPGGDVPRRRWPSF
jgi:hypothetical protein